jgi:hypothetical protein
MEPWLTRSSLLPPVEEPFTEKTRLLHTAISSLIHPFFDIFVLLMMDGVLANITHFDRPFTGEQYVTEVRDLIVDLSAREWADHAAEMDQETEAFASKMQWLREKNREEVQEEEEKARRVYINECTRVMKRLDDWEQEKRLMERDSQRLAEGFATVFCGGQLFHIPRVLLREAAVVCQQSDTAKYPTVTSPASVAELERILRQTMQRARR